MREHLARIVAALSGVLVLLVVLGFGLVQNPPELAAEPAPDPQRVLAGRAVYEAQGCAICHTLAGEGDNQYPLDGIGARMNSEQIRLSIAPTSDMRGRFLDGVYEAKQGYQALPQEDMENLVAYLRSVP